MICLRMECRSAVTRSLDGCVVTSYQWAGSSSLGFDSIGRRLLRTQLGILPILGVAPPNPPAFLPPRISSGFAFRNTRPGRYLRSKHVRPEGEGIIGAESLGNERRHQTSVRS